MPKFTLDIDKLFLYVLIAIGLYIFNKSINKKENVDHQETITKTEIIELIKEFKNTEPSKIKTIRVPVYKDRIINKTDTIYLEGKSVDTNVVVSKFVDTTDAVKIESTIYSYNKLLNRDIKITNKEKIVTNSTTKYIQKNNLFYTVGASFNFDKSIKSVNTGIIYVNKNKFIIGADINYDVTVNSNKTSDKLYFAPKIGFSF